MLYGPKPANRLPEQDARLLLLLADRWQRAFTAHAKWAGPAKQCVDFFEGRQWTAAQIAELAKQGRPALKFNKIAPIVRLVVGYQRNNKIDLKALPDIDSDEANLTAEAITRIFKDIAQGSAMQDQDGEVFLDGLLTGRGVYDGRLCFEENDLGTMKVRADDPFFTYFDPDAIEYDTRKHGFQIESRWGCIDEIETLWGKHVAEMITPFTLGQTPLGPIALEQINGEIVPIRSFGQKEDAYEHFEDFYTRMGDFSDPLRRSIRILDFQHKVKRNKSIFVDLETGDFVPVPDNWGRMEIEKTIAYAASRNNPIALDRRVLTSVQWTTIIGDMIVHNKPSPYNQFTKIGYFPYFRRGYAAGMVEDMIDPMSEVNKRRSSLIDMVMRSANPGWMYHEKTFTNAERLKLKSRGAAPGAHVVWNSDVPAHKPERLQPGAYPVGIERLLEHAENDLQEISGINAASLGQMDQVQSGRALEARQRQAVISVQMYMDNFNRTKRIQGQQMLDIVQNHYTEQRQFRILGEDGKFVSFVANQDVTQPGTSVRKRLLDITLGKYTISINEVPFSASFLNAQFEEAMNLIAKLGPAGLLLVQKNPELLIEMSSLPRKEEWIMALKGLAAQTIDPTTGQPIMPAPGGAPMPDGGGTPATAGVSIDQAGGINGPEQIDPTGNVVRPQFAR